MKHSDVINANIVFYTYNLEFIANSPDEGRITKVCNFGCAPSIKILSLADKMAHKGSTNSFRCGDLFEG